MFEMTGILFLGIHNIQTNYLHALETAIVIVTVQLGWNAFSEMVFSPFQGAWAQEYLEKITVIALWKNPVYQHPSQQTCQLELWHMCGIMDQVCLEIQTSQMV